MSRLQYIALDTHQSFCDMAVLNSQGDVVKRERCSTDIPSLVGLLQAVAGRRKLTFEEGPMAGWLARNLREHVEELIVCEPRRNAYIAKDGDKDDPIDAVKLAQLLRGGYLKAVHQVDCLDRELLKQHVAFYHHRVRERVRQGHQITSLLRRQGVFATIAELADPQTRRTFWKKMPQHAVLQRDLNALWAVYELMCTQEEQIRADLVRLARRHEPVRRFVEVPGISWIRAATFYVYLDTPQRFTKKSALWRYCGIGLERHRSGTGPTRVRLAKAANRHLKNMLMGAARSAAARAETPFADKYQYWTQEKGQHPVTAYRNVARTIASMLWGMWKDGSKYDPDLIRGVGRKD